MKKVKPPFMPWAKRIDWPVGLRIADAVDARRCVAAVVEHLRIHESPAAAEDLERSLVVLINEAQRNA